jgi:hypothetical protein
MIAGQQHQQELADTEHCHQGFGRQSGEGRCSLPSDGTPGSWLLLLMSIDVHPPHALYILCANNHIQHPCIDIHLLIFTGLLQVKRHIPYRDSKLTRLLQPSLSGNSHMAIITTISPAAGTCFTAAENFLVDLLLSRW